MVETSASNHETVADFLLDQPPFLTVLQASKLLRVSTWALYQVIRSGELPVIRWGRRVVLQREDLAVFLASKRDDGHRNSIRPPRPRFDPVAQRPTHSSDIRITKRLTSG
jgi:excisionase family DNA binding protein